MDEDYDLRGIDLFAEDAQLAVARHGYLISHAGVYPSIWPQDLDLHEGVRHLNQTMRSIRDAATPDSLEPPITATGRARGGTADFGGPLWLDWEQEFEDSLAFPQICGHSVDAAPRQKGRSWCLDAGQTAYATLNSQGVLRVHHMT